MSASSVVVGIDMAKAHVDISVMGAKFVSGWARHLDRAADSGSRLPAVWQQFLNAAVHVRWQSCQHVPQISPRVMPMQLC